MEILSIDGVSCSVVENLAQVFSSLPATVKSQIVTDAVYDQYLDRQRNDVEILKREEALSLPDDMEFGNITGLSFELTSKLNKVRPNSIARAKEIEGMTPAALLLIIGHIRRQIRRAS